MNDCLWNPSEKTRQRIAVRAAKQMTSESEMWVKHYEDLRNQALEIITRIDTDPEDVPSDADPWRSVLKNATYYLETRPWGT